MHKKKTSSDITREQALSILTPVANKLGHDTVHTLSRHDLKRYAAQSASNSGTFKLLGSLMKAADKLSINTRQEGISILAPVASELKRISVYDLTRNDLADYARKNASSVRGTSKILASLFKAAEDIPLRWVDKDSQRFGVDPMTSIKVHKRLYDDDITTKAYPRGEFNYVQVSIANHHSNYFDVVVSPVDTTSSMSANFLRTEILGTQHPLCGICSKERKSECPGHRIGMQLPFLMIQPQFSTLFTKFLNAICLGVSYENGKLKFHGCCMPRITSFKKGETLIGRMKPGGLGMCKKCSYARTDERIKFISAKTSYGGLEYKNPEFVEWSGSIPVSLMALFNYMFSDKESEYIEKCPDGTALTRTLDTNTKYSMSFFSVGSDIRNCVTSCLYIPPYQLRPKVGIVDSRDTALYLNIFEMCTNVRYPSSLAAIDSINSSEHQNSYLSIYNTIETLMSQKSKNNEETLFLKLPGKFGLIRFHVTSSFTSNIGRAVATPSEGNFGEFMMSTYFRKLCKEERVNMYNIDLMKTVVDKGYAIYIKRHSTGELIKYKPGISISIGDSIYRQLVSGDLVIANRQPTLHRHSIMAHNARLVSRACFGGHSSETVTYCLDFDGDEMNAFIPTTIEADFELSAHGHAINCIIGAGVPALAPVFHDLAIMMLLSTIADQKIDNPAPYIDTFLVCPDFLKRKKSYPWRRKIHLQIDDDEPVITYRDICSLLFPEDFSYTERDVKIRDGVFISGKFDKSNLGLKEGSITHALSFYPSKRIGMFINDISRLCTMFMNHNAVSLNPGTMIHSMEYYREIGEINDMIQPELESVIGAMQNARSNTEINSLDRNVHLIASTMFNRTMKSIDGTEQAAKQILAKYANDPVKKESVQNQISKAMAKDVFRIMYVSGARGSKKSAAQMTMSLGEQFVGAKRVNVEGSRLFHNHIAAKNARNKRRTTTLESGIINSSFNRGLTAREYVVHSGPVRYAVTMGKLEVSKAGHLGKQMSSVFASSFRTAHDMAIVNGKCVIAYSLGAFIDPTAMLVGKKDGYGTSLFVSPSTLVSSVNYQVMKNYAKDE